MITFFIRRYAAPRRSASAEVSPIVPPIVPINILRTLVATCVLPSPDARRSATAVALSPFLMIASGVAPVTPSYVNEVIFPANEIMRKHLAPSAGFIKF